MTLPLVTKHVRFTLIQRRGTTQQWADSGRILQEGELGYDTTLKLTKMGDGVHYFSALPALGSGGGSLVGAVRYDISQSLTPEELTQIRYNAGLPLTIAEIDDYSFDYDKTFSAAKIYVLHNEGLQAIQDYPSVIYTSQTLTDDQKAQVLANIGAVEINDVDVNDYSTWSSEKIGHRFDNVNQAIIDGDDAVIEIIGTLIEDTVTSNGQTWSSQHITDVINGSQDEFLDDTSDDATHVFSSQKILDLLEAFSAMGLLIPYAGFPSAGIGENGMFTIDTTSPMLKIYGPKTNGSWASFPSTTVQLIPDNTFEVYGAAAVERVRALAAEALLAVDTAVMHLTGTESAGGNKTFTGNNTFSGTTNITSLITISNALRMPYTSRSAAATLTTASAWASFCDATTAAYTVTLPATTTTGYRFLIVKSDASANGITISPGAGGTINGQATMTLAAQFDWIEVISTGTSGIWFIVNSHSKFMLADARYLQLSASQTVTGTPTFNAANFNNTVTMNSAPRYTPTVRISAFTLTTTGAAYNHCDGSTAAFTITMPATTTAGIVFMFKKTDASVNGITIALSNIDGVPGNIVLVNQGDFIFLESTSTSGNWLNVGSSPRYTMPHIPNTVSTASSATPAINVNIVEEYDITALTVAATFSLNGTPTNGQELFIRVASASALALTWPATFLASGNVALPTTTVAGKTVSLKVRYNSTAVKWIAQQADPVGY